MNRVFGQLLCSGMAAALLAACGGSPPLIGAPGAMPQPQGIAALADGGKTWMQPGTPNEDLLYASGSSEKWGLGVQVFSYPKGSVVGQLTLTGVPNGLCSDRSGNVFIPVPSSKSKTNYVYEYAHGGTTPIATLADSGVPYGCAVDPTTGNLAVTNVFGLGMGAPPGNVAIYAGAQGTPSYYSDPEITLYGFCAYDDAGNLFVSSQRPGDPIGELPEGEGSFKNIIANLNAGSLQWNKGNLVVAAYDGSEGIQNVYRVKISGTTGTIVGTTSLQYNLHNKHEKYLIFGQFWVQGASIVGPNFHGDRGLRPSLWRYPKGGKQVRLFGSPGFRMSIGGGAGVTVSVAPSSKAGINRHSTYNHGHTREAGLR
jgi:hypothetical protein